MGVLVGSVEGNGGRGRLKGGEGVKGDGWLGLEEDKRALLVNKETGFPASHCKGGWGSREGMMANLWCWCWSVYPTVAWAIHAGWMWAPLAMIGQGPVDARKGRLACLETWRGRVEISTPELTMAVKL